MSTPRKPPMASTVRSNTERRGSAVNESPSARNASPARTLSSQGTAKTSSTRDPSYVARPNRASMQSTRRPSSIIGSIGNIEDVAVEENIRIENAALVENLRKSLKTADLMAEENKTLMSVLQKKHDELLKDYGKLEEQYHDTTQKLGDIEAKRKEESRSVREMANLYESERMSMLRDREDASKREEELRKSIQRLKETMAGREMRFNIAADHERRLSRSATRGRSDERSTSVDGSLQFAPLNSLQRRDSSIHRGESKNNSRLVLQKDTLIESLRLELAEAQIKLVEMENMGGNHMQELEKQLLETRMANARLMEDNESFQLLLGEKSLNGDIMKTDLIQGTPFHSTGLSSLAEELETAEGGESDRIRRLELENRSIREEKKALTLYIEKIISRVLQHDNFEKILDQKPVLRSSSPPPPAPPLKDDVTQEKPSVIQRAMSVVGPRKRPASQLITGTAAAHLQQEIATASKARPQSHIFSTPLPHTPTAHENPDLAPSIPLNRTTSVNRAQRHRRTQSTQSTELTGAAAVINQMYQGSNNDGGPISPVSPGTTIPRANYFNGTAIRDASSTPSRIAGKRSTSAQQPVARDTDSVHSRPGSRSSNNEIPSPPRNAGGSTVYTGAVMTQHKLRPLRLVQQKKEVDSERAKQEAQTAAEEEAARKKANRNSWMPGWFNRGADTPRTPSTTAQE